MEKKEGMIVRFLLQKEEELDIDILILRNELDKQRLIHAYEYNSLDNLKKNTVFTGESLKSFIPVGTLEFVGEWLLKSHGITNMNPIEIPKVLRKEEFLKRNYQILNKDELPKQGYCFIKYASRLKEFSHIGLIETLYEDGINGKVPFLKDGFYVVSEAVEILAEYRCFIYQDELLSLSQYDGECIYQPDINLIRKAINTYMFDLTRPKAYTIDIAVIKDRGTAVLEIHPFVSVGLYSYLFGSELPYCYQLGLDWYLDENQEIEK